MDGNDRLDLKNVRDQLEQARDAVVDVSESTGLRAHKDILRGMAFRLDGDLDLLDALIRGG